MSSILRSIPRFVNRVIITIFLLYSGISCTTKTDNIHGNADNNKQPDTTFQIPGIYMGMLPCTDCSGIEYTLTMNPDSTFILKSTYLGKPADHNTFIEAGQWSVTGSRNLLLELPQENLYLKQMGKNLLWLDNQGNIIKSKQNYQLSRIGNFE